MKKKFHEMSCDSRKVSTLCWIKFKFLLPVRKDLLALNCIKMKYILNSLKFIMIGNIYELEGNLFP